MRVATKYGEAQRKSKGDMETRAEKPFAATRSVLFFFRRTERRCDIQFPCLHASVHDRVRSTYMYIYVHTYVLMYKYLGIHMRLSTIIRIRLAKRTRGEVAINRDRSGRSHAYVHASVGDACGGDRRACALAFAVQRTQTPSR